MVRKISGFTVIELAIVIAIIGILMAIAIPYFSNWKSRYALEQDARNIASLINKARNKAFTEKVNFVISISGKTACISCKPSDSYCKSLYTGNIECIKLNNPYSTYTISVSTRGTLNNITVFPVLAIQDSYGCVKVSTFRAKVGIIKGANCEIH